MNKILEARSRRHETPYVQVVIEPETGVYKQKEMDFSEGCAL